MEDVSCAGDAEARASPPPPPEPRSDDGTLGVDPDLAARPDEPLNLTSEHWDINSISALAALRMLMNALEMLAEATGDIPPTPPVSRPSTPRRRAAAGLLALSKAESAEVPAMPIGSPEAHPHEPVTEQAPVQGASAQVHGVNAQAHYIQHAAIARRFFSKLPPPFSISDYLLRLHKWCAHSPGVYLAAASFVQRLCVAELAVPATNRTIHRLALASIRVAAKALEDNKWPQERMAKVGGVSKLQLMNLEVTLCFLLDFDLWVDDILLARRMYLLQQAAQQGSRAMGSLGESFRLSLPLLSRRSSAVLVP